MVLLNTGSTVEAVIFKGNFKNLHLHKLLMRMKNLEVRHRARILVSHVSGGKNYGSGY